MALISRNYSGEAELAPFTAVAAHLVAAEWPFIAAAAIDGDLAGAQFDATSRASMSVPEM